MKQLLCDSFFANFANDCRLNIMLLLKSGPLDVTTISQKTNMEQSAVSHNLRKMETCHILESKRKGKQIFYSLNKKTVIPILKVYEKHVKDKCFLRCKDD